MPGFMFYERLTAVRAHSDYECFGEFMNFYMLSFIKFPGIAFTMFVKACQAWAC